jgi:HEPN domain-containing protein
MLSQERVKSLINYWIEGSKENLKTVVSLYKTRRYSDCLFFGHLILEKVLKAHVVKETKLEAPKTHNLSYLVKLSKLSLSDDNLEFLAKINKFNMETRYPNEKLNFYKLCTKNYTDQYYKLIILLYKNLCQKIK